MKKVVLCSILLLSSCDNSVVDSFDPKNRIGKLPNLAVESYISENPTRFCGEHFSTSEILKSVSNIDGANNQKAEFYLRMGMCFAMNGDEDIAVLYMMRTINYSGLVETDNKAKKIALSYLKYGEDFPSKPFSKSNTIDAAWACQVMLDGGISLYSYRETSQELSDLKCRMLLKHYKQSNNDQKMQ